MSTTSTEVLIVGAGVIGSSIAYHLARQGRRVLVVERSEVAAPPAASWASAGGVRRQGRHPAEAKLAIEAIERWKTLEQELEADLHYRRGGNLLLAESGAEADQLSKFVDHQRELGFSDVRVIDPETPSDESRGVLAEISTFPQILEGSAALVPSRQDCGPTRSNSRNAEAAQETLRTRMFSGRFQGGRQARLYALPVNAQLAPGREGESDGIEHAGQPGGVEIPLDQLLTAQPTVGTPVEPYYPTADRRSFTMRPTSIESNWAVASEMLPAVGEQRIANSWCGLEAQSIDGIPFIGSIPGLDGLTLAVGFSGHGFALAPAVGRCVADKVNGRPTPELEGLSPARIATLQQNSVDRFITEIAETD